MADSAYFMERIREYTRQQQDEALWETMTALAGNRFYTAEKSGVYLSGPGRGKVCGPQGEVYHTGDGLYRVSSGAGAGTESYRPENAGNLWRILSVSDFSKALALCREGKNREKYRELWKKS